MKYAIDKKGNRFWVEFGGEFYPFCAARKPSDFIGDDMTRYVTDLCPLPLSEFKEIE